MNKVLHSFLFLLTGVLCASCIEINGSGYSDLTETEKQHVKKCTSDLGALQNDGNLYQITVKQVKEYIRKERNVVVYEYLPFCSGESGRSPMEVKAYCDEKELKCLVISSVYDGIFPIPTTNTFPMLVIDHQVYGTDNYQEYSNQFYQQLTGSNEDSRMESSFHLFSNGKYVRSIVSLMDLCKMSDLKEVAEDVAQEQEDNVLSVLEKKE